MVSGDRFNGVVLPGDAPTDEALADFPQLADLQRLYHGVPNGFSETPRTASSPGSGSPTRSTTLTTFRAGVGRFLNRVQINTTAAYGFNAPLSEMQTVINGIVDAPGGASTRNFPLVGAMQSPTSRIPYRGRGTRRSIGSCRGRCAGPSRTSAARHRTSNGPATSTSSSPARFRRIPASNANALRPYLGFSS